MAGTTVVVRGLVTVLAAAGLAAGSAVASATPNAAPLGAVMLQNGGFPGSVLTWNEVAAQ